LTNFVLRIEGDAGDSTYWISFSIWFSEYTLQ